MKTPLIDRDLTKQAPDSPRYRVSGFSIAGRAADKCRASLSGKLGDYHYNCPLDNKLFSFKGIDADQFKAAVVASSDYEQIGEWLVHNGTPKSPSEVKTWSDNLESGSPILDPEKKAYFTESCLKLGLNPQTTSAFDWLEADDRESFDHKRS